MLTSQFHRIVEFLILLLASGDGDQVCNIFGHTVKADMDIPFHIGSIPVIVGDEAVADILL